MLVVEDEALLALELETGLRELGCEVVGPARNLTEAQRLAETEPRLAAAVLDVNLGGGELVFTVADALAARGVPYLLATGYGSAGPLEGRDAGAVAVLRTVRSVVPAEFCVVSAGGVETADDVRERLAAGADLVQGYTAFIYRGPFWARQINRALARTR